MTLVHLFGKMHHLERHLKDWTMFFHTSYLDCIYDNPENYAELVARVSKKVLELKTKFHAIAFRGTSGAAMAYPVSIATGIPLICIRKPTEDAHGDPVEGSTKFDVKKYIIIDDFMSSGATVDAIIESINKHSNNSVKCVGIVLYGNDYNSYNKWGDIPVTRIKNST